jgi:hypothetical protein
MDNMIELRLLTLDLKAALPYDGMENPPLTGETLAGAPRGALSELVSALAAGRGAGGSGASGEAAALPSSGGRGGSLAEGEEELFVFDETQLVLFDLDEGPRVPRPLPLPGFYGRGGKGRASGFLEHGAGREVAAPSNAGIIPGDPAPRPAEYMIPPGRYLFLQFRPADEEELAEGLEYFAREAWWTGAACVGPWMLRRLREDGRMASQILRRLAG